AVIKPAFSPFEQLLERGRYPSFSVLPALHSGHRNHMIPVEYHDRRAAELVYHVCRRACASGPLVYRRIFLEYYLAVAVCIYLKRVALPYTHGAAYFLRDDDPA